MVNITQSTTAIVSRASQAGVVIPAFNVPYLPMMEPIIQAVVDQDSFALLETARLEWIKFASHGPAAVMAEFARWNHPEHVRLHLDHVPVIDEDGLDVDFVSILHEAIDLGYGSVMVDGSRLSLDANINATQRAVELAHHAGVACEAELGAVLGHESGPLPPYEELFRSGRGFTNVVEAARFVRETGCDWLSVAIGNIHGAVSGVLKDQKKVQARLDLKHLDRLRRATGVPLVLHGGSGIPCESLLGAVKKGIAKVNVGTELRQAYESTLHESASLAAAQEAVYARTTWFVRDCFHTVGTHCLALEGIP
jgi:ketose-bisphosphate aldolase